MSRIPLLLTSFIRITSYAYLSLFLLVIVPSTVSGNIFYQDNIMRVHTTIARAKRACFCSTSYPHTLRAGYRRVFSSSSTIVIHAHNDIGDARTRTSPPTFYERLNSPKHILAPMVAQSDLPFRLMCEQLYNVDLSYTQMIHAYNFVEANGEIFRANHLDVYPQSAVRDVLLGKEDGSMLMVSQSQSNALKGLSVDDIKQSRKRILTAIAQSKGIESLSEDSEIEVKSTIVQIAAHDPDVAVDAAMMILERSGSMESLQNGEVSSVAGIDLNLGCPQSIARKGRYGSFLHDESPEVTYQVLTKLRSELPSEIGVTAKIRLPPTQADADAGRLGNISSLGSGPQTIDERMKCLIDCGVDLITVHGRTRFENKVAVAAASWTAIRQATAIARSYSGDNSYPIFSNGGIEFNDDIQMCLDSTKASGVMSSESLLEMPGIFGERMESCNTARALLDRQLGYADMYLDFATIFPPLPGSLGTKDGSYNVIRSHLFKFLHRYLEETPKLRSWLGNQEMNTIKQARQLITDLRSRYDNIGEEQLTQMNSWSKDSSWYRRHRKQDIQQRQNQSASTLSIEEKKQLAKLRIQKMQEERKKRSVSSI